MTVAEKKLRRIVIEEMSSGTRLPPMSSAQKELSLWKAIQYRIRNGSREDVMRELVSFIDSIDPEIPWEDQYNAQ